MLPSCPFGIHHGLRNVKVLTSSDLSRWVTLHESRNAAEAQVRAEEARRGDGDDAPADHRGGDRAARNRRAGPDDAERGRQARRRRAAHPLPPLPHRGRPLRGLLNHYFTANPWPDLDSWRAIRDPQQRLERALDELYAYYERTEPMFSNVLRDAELVDFARDAVAPLHAYLDEAAEVLTVGRRPRPKRQLLAAAAPRGRFPDLALTRQRRHHPIRSDGTRDRTRRSGREPTSHALADGPRSARPRRSCSQAQLIGSPGKRRPKRSTSAGTVSGRISSS